MPKAESRTEPACRVSEGLRRPGSSLSQLREACEGQSRQPEQAERSPSVLWENTRPQVETQGPTLLQGGGEDAALESAL